MRVGVRDGGRLHRGAPVVGCEVMGRVHVRLGAGYMCVAALSRY